jgi:hypothetical protein
MKTLTKSIVFAVISFLFLVRVSSALATPTLSSISPNPVTGSSSAQTFTLTGSGFVNGAKVQVAFASNGYTFVNTSTNATFVSSTQLTVPITTSTTADTWKVRVQNPDTTLSGQINLVVNAPAATPAPTLSSISPNPVTGSNSAQTFTLTGSNFVSGAKVQVAFASNGYTFTNTSTNASFVSSTQLTVPITTSTTADTWKVRVQNPDSQLSGQINLVVNAPTSSTPAPTLSSISPNPVIGSSSAQTFTLSGANFVSGAKVQVAFASNGYTFTNTSTNASFVNSTQLTVPITTSTTADTWKVRVQNPDSQLSGQINLVVNAPTSTPAPTLSSISPNPVTGSSSAQTFTLTGSNFVSGAKVQVAFASNGYTFTNTSTNANFINSTQLTVPITTSTTADTWKVRVQNPDGQFSGQINLVVNAPTSIPAPTLSSISPNPVTGSSTAQTFTLTGSNFVSGAKVQVAFASNGYAFTNTSTNASFVSSTQLAVPITTSTTADTWKVRVQNPDGQLSGQVDLLVNSPGTTSLTCTSISPNSVTGSTASRDFIIYGSGFANGAIVQVAFQSNNYQFQNTNNPPTYISSSQLKIQMTTGTTVDTWRVRVRNPDLQVSNETTLNVAASQTSTPTSVVISGPTQVGPNSSTDYKADLYFSDGSHQDASGSAVWAATGGPAETGTFGQAIMLGNTLITNVATSTIPLQISATYKTSTGQITSNPYFVTVAGSGVGMTNPSKRFIRPSSGANYVWNIQASLYGSAVGNGSAYQWFIDNQQLAAGGASLSYELTSQVGQHEVKAIVTDAQNRTTSVARTFALDRPALNEPGQKYDAIPPDQGTFVDASGQPFQFDSNRIDHGLIIITHGLRGSESDDWLKYLGSAIPNRLGQLNKPIPNIAIFGWKDGADPTKFYDANNQDPALSAAILRISRNAFDVFNTRWGNPGSFIFDILAIRGSGVAYGDTLALWMQSEIGRNHINKNAPIQLIGHSAGGFVVGQAAWFLKKQNIANVNQVTMLDTPFPLASHFKDYPNPGAMERYISSMFGNMDSDLGGLFDPNQSLTTLPFSPIEQGTYFHRRQVSSILFPTTTAHAYSHDWYIQTALGQNGEQDGFYYSPFMGNHWSSSPNGLSPRSLASIEVPNATSTTEPITAFLTFGSVTSGGGEWVLAEDTDAGITAQMTLAPGAQELRFSYQFTSPGDGDFIAVYFGDSLPLYLGLDSQLAESQPLDAVVPISQYAGRNGTVVIKLVSRGQRNAVVQLSNIRLTIASDPDNDGLTTDQEIALGTDPLVSDTDGDGLSDGDEVNVYHTNPQAADSDGDGIRDGDEIAGGSDPLSAYSQPSVVHLANISTRLSVSTGDNAMIGGFIITGTLPKRVIVRGLGPSLANFGLTGVLADPTLELHDSSQVIGTNDDWQTNANKQEMIDRSLAPSDPKEAAILTRLNPGTYTAILRGANNGTGIGTVEVYDLDQTVDSKLANISTRGFVNTGDNVMIGGTIIIGTASASVLIRAIGPSLTNFGVPNALQNPTLELHNVQGGIIAANDNWINSPDAAAISSTGLQPTDNRESAIVQNLAPGAYTAIVRGSGSSTGVAIVEAYQLSTPTPTPTATATPTATPTPTPNPTPVVLFLDNFDGNSLDLSKWTVEISGSATVANGIVSIAAGGGNWSGTMSTSGKVILPGHPYTVEFRARRTNDFDLNFNLTDGTNTLNIMESSYPSNLGFRLNTSGAFGISNQGNGNATTAWKEYRITVNGTSVTAQRGDSLSNLTETLTQTLADSVANHPLFLRFGNAGPNTVDIDWVRVTSQ